MDLNDYVGVFTAAGIGIFIMGVVVIVLEALKESTTSGSVAEQVINGSLALFSGLTSKFATIGSVAGVLALLVLIGLIGLFGYRAIKTY